MLKRSVIVLVILSTLLAQLPVSASTVVPYIQADAGHTTVLFLPRWVEGLDGLPSPMSPLPPGPDAALVGEAGVTRSLPIGMDGFSISFVPTTKGAQQESVWIAPSPTRTWPERREGITFLGDPFIMGATSAPQPSYLPVSILSGYPDSMAVQRPAGLISSTLSYPGDVVLQYGDEANLVLLALIDGKWKIEASAVDVEKDQLLFWLRPGQEHLFRLGMLSASPTIVLDPDANVAYVNRTRIGGRTFPTVHELPLNVQTAERVRDRIQGYTDGCGEVITVELTYEDGAGTYPSPDVRVNRILGWHPDLAVVIAYDAHVHTVVENAPGGIKVLFVDRNYDERLARRLVSALRSYYNRTHGNSTGLYRYQASRDGYMMGSFRMPPSTEKDVALHSSITIVRVEVGLLSGYPNRVRIDNDFARPPDERVIPTLIANAMMNTLNMRVGCFPCSDVDAFPVRNGRFDNSEAAECVLKRLMAPVPLSRDFVTQPLYNLVLTATDTMTTSDDGDLCGLIPLGSIGSNPPIMVWGEKGPDGRLSNIVLPTEQYVSEIAAQMLGVSSKVVISDYVQYYDSLNGLVHNTVAITAARLLSNALSVGACMGLIAWVAKRCAGIEPLTPYGVSSVDQLSVNNQRFLETILWYQMMQLSEEALQRVRPLSPLSLYATLEASGTKNALAPRIAVFAPDTETTSCKAGEIPAGHTLFVVGTIQNGDDKALSVFDPNSGEKFTIDIDEDNDQWIYHNAPYTLPVGGRTWRGSVIYVLAPSDVPPYPDDGEGALNIHFIIDDQTSAVGGYGAHFITGYGAHFLAGYGAHFLGAERHDAGDYCIAITPTLSLNIPWIPAIRRYPSTENFTMTLWGNLYGSNMVAETLRSQHGEIVFVSEATSETINTLGILTDTHGITVTTNMSDQHIAVSLYREVDSGQTNRIFNVRDTVLHHGEVLKVHASPHNNLFIVDNTQGSDRQIDLLIATVGRPGVTSYFTRGLQVNAGHIMTITAWSWENLSDSLVFAYDGNGYTTTSYILQDVVRPTQIVFATPSYVSGTVTYVTPRTEIAFDVMPATCGISATLYRIDGGAFQVYTHPFTLEGLSEGHHLIEYYSVDNIGNVEPLNSAEIYLYSQPPQGAITLEGEIDSGGWYTPPVTITLLTTATVLPIDETRNSCQVRPWGRMQLYTRPFQVDESAQEVLCVVYDMAGLSLSLRRHIPIRNAQADILKNALGEPAISEEERQRDYQEIIRQSYDFPGTVEQSLGAGVCNGVPLRAGDILLPKQPFLDIPILATLECHSLPMRALYAGSIGLFVSVITDTRTSWEAPAFLDFLSSYLGIDSTSIVTMTETDIKDGALANVSMLILPAIEESFVDRVLAELGTEGLTAIKDFVADGGYLYASGGYAAAIPVAAGVISASVVSPVPLVALDNTASIITQANVARPLTLNWLTETVYVPNGDLVLSPGGNLTAVATYSGTNAPGTAAILYGPFGKGHIVVANHHPLVSPYAPTHHPFLVDVILDAMAYPVALFLQGEQHFTETMPYDTIPAEEADIPVSVTVGVDYLDPLITGTLAALTITLSPAFYFPVSQTGWIITDDGHVALLSITETMPLTYGRHIFNISARTASTEAMRAGVADLATVECSIRYGEGQAYTLQGATIQMKAEPQPDVFVYQRPEPEVIYGLSRDRSTQIEMAIGEVNDHEGAAVQNVYTTIIPLIVPVLDTSMRDVVTDANGHTVWIEPRPTFNEAPLPEQVWYPGQSFDLSMWDGQTVITLTLPPDSPVELPFPFYSNGCDRIDGGPCCEDGSVFPQVGIIRTATQTLVVLPAVEFSWRLGALNGYEYKDPVIRYTLRPREINGRDVRFMAGYDPHETTIYEDQEAVYLRHHGAIWISAGRAPLDFTGRVVSTTPIYDRSLSAYVEDFWGRKHTYLDWAKRLFFIAPYGEPDADGASRLNVTMGAVADTNGDGTVEPLTGALPADRPVTVCFETVLIDYGRQQTQTGTYLMRFPVGLGYKVAPAFGDWALASTSRNGYAVYSSTVEAEGDYHVFYSVTLPAGAQEVLTTCIVVSPYPGINREGPRPVLQGTFYFYPNDLDGDIWPFNLETSFAMAGWALQYDIQVTPQVVPYRLGHAKTPIFYMVEVNDLQEPHTIAPVNSIATFGGGDYAATTYVGGSSATGELLDPLLASEDDEAYIRVELHNNTGITWTDIAITATYPGLLIEPYTPTLNDVTALSEHPHLNLQRLHGYGWSVYYFRVHLDAAHPLSTGGVVEVPIQLTGQEVPEDLAVPPAYIGLPESGRRAVEMVFGRATGLRISVAPGEQITFTEGRIVPLAEASALPWLDPEDAANWYAQWPTVTLSLFTSTMTYEAAYPPLSDTLPISGGEPYVIVLKGEAGPFPVASTQATLDKSPTAVYTNAFGYTQRTGTSPVRLPIRGPVLDALYPGLPDDAMVEAFPLQVVVVNRGDRTAIDPTIVLTFPVQVTVTAETSACTSVTPLSNAQIITCGIQDLIPGARDEESLLFTITSRQGEEMPNHVVEAAEGRYINGFTGREEQVALKGARIDSHIYFPLLARQYEPRYVDLAIAGIQVTPVPLPAEASSVITAAVMNRGNEPITQPFWVDMCIDHPMVVNEDDRFAEGSGIPCVAWYITGTQLPLQPDEVLYLLSLEPQPGYDRWDDRFHTPGVHTIYVLADSYDDIPPEGEDPRGMVIESNEANNQAQLSVIVTTGR